MCVTDETKKLSMRKEEQDRTTEKRERRKREKKEEKRERESWFKQKTEKNQWR